jgi:scyllo-inositol 2-dehydrogenase (NADP+)
MSDTSTFTPTFAPVAAPVRTAVIGYGFAGRSFHSYLIGLTPGLSLHGIASRNPETREKIVAERGCRAYESFEQVIADSDVDLVVLATPSSAHCEQAVAALDAGKHVVTDKVMALTLAECDRMLQAAKRNNRLLTVFQNRRWDGDFLTVQDLMAAGEEGNLGTVRWIEMAWQGFGAWGGWRGKAEMGGGRFYDLGAHLIDQMLVLFPQPVEHVYCRLHRDYPHTDIDSEALLVIGFEGGATGVCDLSGMSAISKPRFTVHGSKATLVKYGLDPQEAAMKAGDIDAAVEDPANFATLKAPGVEWRVPTLPGRWRSYYEIVAAALASGTAPEVKPHEMRRVMAVIDAAFESARTGKTVRPQG